MFLFWVCRTGSSLNHFYSSIQLHLQIHMQNMICQPFTVLNGQSKKAESRSEMAIPGLIKAPPGSVPCLWQQQMLREECMDRASMQKQFLRILLQSSTICGPRTSKARNKNYPGFIWNPGKLVESTIFCRTQLEFHCFTAWHTETQLLLLFSISNRLFPLLLPVILHAPTVIPPSPSQSQKCSLTSKPFHDLITFVALPAHSKILLRPFWRGRGVKMLHAALRSRCAIDLLA